MSPDIRVSQRQTGTRLIDIPDPVLEEYRERSVLVGTAHGARRRLFQNSDRFVERCHLDYPVDGDGQHGRLEPWNS